MPQDTNHNENTNNSSQNDDAQQSGDASQKVSPSVVKGALNNALMRTFRGDIAKNVGPNQAPETIERLIPQTKQQAKVPVPDNTLPQPQKRNEAVVHTFKDDVQNLVRTSKMSMTRIAALESDSDNRNKTEESAREPWKTTVIVSLTVLFLVIGGVLALGAYYAYRLNTTPNLTPQFEPSIIFTEARESVDISEKDARGTMSMLANARRNSIFSLGSIIELYLTRSVETTEGQSVPTHVDAIDFLKTIGADTPDTFVQTLNSDYVVGIHVIDENVPFLILTTRSYGHAFSGMLAWESSIEENLDPFFSPNAKQSKPAVAEGGNAFADTVIQNIDVRILRDSNGEIRMLYAFVDRNTIIATTNIRTLIELARRLRVAGI